MAKSIGEQALRILALETSDSAGSAALLEGERLLAEKVLAPGQRSARALAPAVRELLQGVGWQPKDVELVAVTVGPGSFTGLRIGVTTAKAFAYAAGSALVGVNTLDAIARQTPPELGRFWTVIDAQRQELFAAEFEWNAAGNVKCSQPVQLIASKAWLALLRPGVCVTGPGLKNLFEQLPDGVAPVEATRWNPTAETVGKLGLSLFLAGQQSDVFSLAPLYLRRPAAEEQWDRKQL